MSALPRLLLKAILVASAVLIAVTSVYQPPRHPPDERRHYAYIKYLSENFWEFPPDRDEVYVDREGDPNTAVQHPPLYHYLLAVPYRVLDPTKDYTSVVREVDRYGRVSSRVVIPILRMFSVLIAVGGLVGFYLLLRYLVEKSLLKEHLALPPALLVVFIPSFIYQSAAINNDSLAFALWPYAVLFPVRFFFEKSARDFWASLLFLSAAVLTKATLWILVFGFGLLVAYSVVERARAAEVGLGSVWREVRRPAVGTALTALVAIVFFIVSTIWIGENLLRYGTLQPSTTEIFGLAKTELGTYKARGKAVEVVLWNEGRGRTETEDKITASLGYLLSSAAELNMKTLAGLFSHGERLPARYPIPSLKLFLLSLIGVLVASVAWFLRPIALRARVPVTIFLLTPVLYLCAYLWTIVSQFERQAYFAAQGRYHLPYLAMAFVGLAMLVSQSGARSSSWAAGRAVILSLSLIGLASIFVRPLEYTSRSVVLYERSNIPSLVQRELVRRGFVPAAIDWANQQRLLTRGFGEGRGPKGTDEYIFAWKGLVAGATIEPHEMESVLEAALWLQGDREGFQGAKLRVGVGAPETGEIEVAGSPLVEADDEIEVYFVRVPVKPEDGPRMLYVEFLNQEVPLPDLLARHITVSRTPRVFGLFYRYVDADG